MPVDMTALAADLAAETDSLRSIVAPLTAEEWLTPTPAPDWTVADGPDHGDLGPRAGRGRCAGGRTDADPGAAPRRSYRGPGLRQQLRGPRPAGARRAGAGRAGRSGRRPVDLGPGGRRRQGGRP